MADKFQNKYRIPSARLQTWDYAWNAPYFVTICTKNRECFFGNIVGTPQGNEMELSEIGKMVEMEWIKTPEIRPDMNLQLGAFCVMPNHFHGIMVIGENEYNMGVVDGSRRDAMHRVSTVTRTTFAPQSKNLASIIRGFKSAVTIHARQIHADFAWQPRFYDHIIRDDASFKRISEYIIHNPAKWTDDTFHRK